MNRKGTEKGKDRKRTDITHNEEKRQKTHMKDTKTNKNDFMLD